MDPFTVHRHGLVLDKSTVASPSAARAAATNWLIKQGVDPWDAEAEVEQTLVARSWWGGDDVGFVGPDYPNAAAVVVVHLAVQPTPSEVRAAETRATRAATEVSPVGLRRTETSNSQGSAEPTPVITDS